MKRVCDKQAESLDNERAIYGIHTEERGVVTRVQDASKGDIFLISFSLFSLFYGVPLPDLNTEGFDMRVLFCNSP
jgi:hypothetical protein